MEGSKSAFQESCPPDTNDYQSVCLCLCDPSRSQTSSSRRTSPDERGQTAPGPAVVPPTAASALLKKVAMFCSFAVGGRPPT